MVCFILALQQIDRGALEGVAGAGTGETWRPLYAETWPATLRSALNPLLTFFLYSQGQHQVESRHGRGPERYATSQACRRGAPGG